MPALGAYRTSINIYAAEFSVASEFFGLEIAHPPRPSRQRRRAGQRLLAIAVMIGRARAAAERPGRLAPLMFLTRRERFFGLRRGLVVVA